jgi:putative ABC transport system permease protein
METLWNDIKHGLRQLRRNPVFALAAIFALTLGIGATTAVITVTRAVLLSAMPFKDPDTLTLATGTLKSDNESQACYLSYLDIQEWKKQNTVFTDIAAFSETFAFNLIEGDQPERLSGEVVSANYFPLLGIRPAAGRFFTVEEDSMPPFTHPVAVLAYDYWMQRFAGDKKILGRDLRLSGRTYKVVGIAPKGFRGLTDQAQVWIPTMMAPVPDYILARRFRWAQVVARLKPGVTVEQAQKAMDIVAVNLEHTFPANQGIGAHVALLKDELFGSLRRGLFILLASAALLLLIACINVANLLLTRAVANQKAVAIRTVLGAPRKRLVRQLLTESLLLSLIGCLLGLILATWATKALIAVSGIDFQSFVHVAIDPLVVGVVVLIAVVCGVAFGLVPIWITAKTNLAQAIEREGKTPLKGSGRHRLQALIIVAQVALSLVLLVGAGLMARGFQRLLHRELGFRPGRILTLRMDVKGDRYNTNPPVAQLVIDALQKVSAVPGVAKASAVTPGVPTDTWAGGYMTIEGQVGPLPDGTNIVAIHGVGPGYFAMLRTPVRKGREFTFGDDFPAERRILVSQEFVDRYWPGKDPIGRRVKFGGLAEPRPWFTVIGVVANMRNQGLLGEDPAGADVYTSVLQMPIRQPLTVNYLVEPVAGTSPESLVNPVRGALHQAVAEFAAYDIATLQERVDKQTAQVRFQVLLISLVTVLALVLAVIGIYGVLSYSVAQATREIGIRMALGAEVPRVVRWIVGRGAALGGVGLAAGLVAALILGRFLQSFLYGVSAADPLILVGMSLFLFAITLVSSYIPARRAAKIDPMYSIREE